MLLIQTCNWKLDSGNTVYVHVQTHISAYTWKASIASEQLDIKKIEYSTEFLPTSKSSWFMNKSNSEAKNSTKFLTAS